MVSANPHPVGGQQSVYGGSRLIALSIAAMYSQADTGGKNCIEHRARAPLAKRL